MEKEGFKKEKDMMDVVIVGAGPAGIAASLNAKKHRLSFRTFEQESLGGTVFTFPRAKVVMTSPMEIPLHGKVWLKDTSKKELLNLWTKVLSENDIHINEQTKVESIQPSDDGFLINTSRGEKILCCKILLAIGRRGTPRKLNVEGEESEKVAYRLLEPERILGKNKAGDV